MRFRALGLIVTVALGLLLAPLAAGAQQAKKVARIGWLGGTHAEPVAHLIEGFRQGLQ